MEFPCLIRPGLLVVLGDPWNANDAPKIVVKY
jgi:hypothetical protein